MKTAIDYRKEQELQNKKDMAELEKCAPMFFVPDGFKTEWRDIFGTRSFRVFKPDDIEFIYRAGGSGTTNFHTAKGERTFDRRGVDDSFHWKEYHFGKGPKPKITKEGLKQIIDEQLERIAKSREFAVTSITVPQIGHNISLDSLVAYKKNLKAGKDITFTPSGFGTGYRVTTRRPNHPFGVQRGNAELEKFFEHSPLWIESFDCD